MSLEFQRCSLFCRDMEASLGFYRDLLGLVVVEDKTIEGAAAGALLRLPPCRMRIVFLAADEQADSRLGLFEIRGVDLASLAYPRGRPALGQTAMLFSTKEFDAMHKRLQAAGTEFLTGPVSYPKREASARSPAGLYREMIVYDPDGQLVSIMQIEPLSGEVQA